MRLHQPAAALVALLGCARGVPGGDAHERHVRVIELQGSPTEGTGGPCTAGRTALPAAGLSLVAEWGDDRGRLAETAWQGPTLPDHRALLWSRASVWVVDTASGQPVRGFRWPASMAGAPERVAVDPAGTSVAAIDASGRVTLGRLDGTSFAALTPDARRGAATPRRLFFSPDSARLAGGDGVWEVSTRRPLITLRDDQELVAVDPSVTRATVTTFVVQTETVGPGSQCGFIQTIHHRVVTGAESLDLLAGTRAAISREEAAALRRPADEADTILAAHPVSDVDLDTGVDLAVVVDGHAWRANAREGRSLTLALPLRDPTALRFTDGGLVARARFQLPTRTLAATAPLTAGGRRALVDGIQSPPNRAGIAVVRDGDGAWALWDVHRMTRVRSLPDPGRMQLGAADQAMVGDEGTVLVRDVAPGRHVFLVADGATWRRVAVPARRSMLVTWSMARDGRHVAFVDGATARVVDLRDGHVRADFPVAGASPALALGDERIALGDDRGLVRVLDLDGVERGRVDLAARFDRPTAMAFRRDGHALAVGTARGRVYVLHLTP